MRLEGARLVLPTLFAWYLPDFSSQETDSEETLASLLRWLPADQQRDMARAVDDPHLELSFEHDWTPLASFAMR